MSSFRIARGAGKAIVAAGLACAAPHREQIHRMLRRVELKMPDLND